jgi:NarL family two-component system response regulator LiaR
MLPQMTLHPSAASILHQRVAGEAEPPAAAILLVDDHDLFRAGLRTLLETQGLRVVGDTRCDATAIDMGRRTRATVALVDTASVEGTSTTPIVEAFAERLPDMSVIMFTRSSDRTDVFRAIRAGARGYVFKGSPVEDLATAIETVRRGAAWLQPTIQSIVLEFVRTGQLPIQPRVDMSEREIEVLLHVAEGLDNNEIAARLGISGKTVKNHVSSILTKLGLTNRVQAAVFAVRSGIA